MNKEQRENTWMNITIKDEYGEHNQQISIQDFLDGNISCITGIPMDGNDPQRDMTVEDFLLVLTLNYKQKHKPIYGVKLPHYGLMGYEWNG